VLGRGFGRIGEWDSVSGPKRTLPEDFQNGTLREMKGAKPLRDKAWEAMTQGDYALALELYDKKFRRHPDKDLIKVRAWLHLGRFEEARSALADAQHRKEERSAPQSYRTDLAVATWLCGKRQLAIEILKIECDAILRGKTGYLNSSFGTEEGAYLFYFGAATKNVDVRRHACAYLEKLGQKRFFMGNPWPPRLHDYFRNRLSDGGMHRLISRIREERSRRIVVFNRTPEEVDAVRALTQAQDLAKMDFWRAIRLHAHEGKRAARPYYQRVSDAPPMLLLSDEWHLARAETKAR
jgi:hypothetical protein